MNENPEYLFVLYGRIPDRRDPPYEYVELLRGTSEYSRDTIERAFYAGSRIEIGEYNLAVGDVLVWFDKGFPLVSLVGETGFQPQTPTAGQCRTLIRIWYDFITEEQAGIKHRPPSSS